MKTNPIDTFSEMLEHAGIEVDRERVKKAIKLVKLDRLSKQEQQKGFGEQSKHQDKFFGAEHQPITPKQKHDIEKNCGRLMKRLGYDTYYKQAS